METGEEARGSQQNSQTTPPAEIAGNESCKRPNEGFFILPAGDQNLSPSMGLGSNAGEGLRYNTLEGLGSKDRKHLHSKFLKAPWLFCVFVLFFKKILLGKFSDTPID